MRRVSDTDERANDMNAKRTLFLAAAMAATLALPFGGTAQGSEFLAAQSRGGSTMAQLTVRVTGLQVATGQVLVGLYDSEDGFEAEQDMRGETVDVTGSEAEITFRNLPVGDYALKVFHDEDGDGKLDTTLGIPSEPYGFSNNASDPFSAPEWDETRFTLPRGRMTQVIDLD